MNSAIIYIFKCKGWQTKSNENHREKWAFDQDLKYVSSNHCETFGWCDERNSKSKNSASCMWFQEKHQNW